MGYPVMVPGYHTTVMRLALALDEIRKGEVQGARPRTMGGTDRHLVCYPEQGN